MSKRRNKHNVINHQLTLIFFNLGCFIPLGCVIVLVVLSMVGIK